MKIILLMTALLLPSLVMADKPAVQTGKADTVHRDTTIAPKDARCDLALNFPGDDKADRRGCCSYHGGVCGCTGSSQLCCDGSPSPSCMCGE